MPKKTQPQRSNPPRQPHPTDPDYDFGGEANKNIKRLQKLMGLPPDPEPPGANPELWPGGPGSFGPREDEMRLASSKRRSRRGGKTGMA